MEGAQKIAVVGAGTMGPGLAQVFAVAGHSVSLFSRTSATLERAHTLVAANLRTFVRQGLIPAEEVPAIVARIEPTTSLAAAAVGAGLVVEAVVEDLEVKREVFSGLDASCPDGTLFTSTTSYLDVFAAVPERRLPHTVIAHWFAPPHIVPLVEVVRGEMTSDATVSATVRLLERLGKVPIVLDRFVPGFCVNRLLRSIGREVFFLLDNGYVTPEQLDRAVKASLAPRAMVLGFVQRYDFTGLDLSLANLQNPSYVEPPRDDAPRSLAERVARGDLGASSGRGFFDYGDRPLEEILAARDDALLRAFAATRDLAATDTSVGGTVS
jgi:3-hydroxybutyryl-CoA dehydrogenase